MILALYHISLIFENTKGEDIERVEIYQYCVHNQTTNGVSKYNEFQEIRKEVQQLINFIPASKV